MSKVEEFKYLEVLGRNHKIDTGDLLHQSVMVKKEGETLGLPAPLCSYPHDGSELWVVTGSTRL